MRGRALRRLCRYLKIGQVCLATQKFRVGIKIPGMVAVSAYASCIDFQLFERLVGIELDALNGTAGWSGRVWSW